MCRKDKQWKTNTQMGIQDQQDNETRQNITKRIVEITYLQQLLVNSAITVGPGDDGDWIHG